MFGENEEGRAALGGFLSAVGLGRGFLKDQTVLVPDRYQERVFSSFRASLLQWCWILMMTALSWPIFGFMRRVRIRTLYLPCFRRSGLPLSRAGANIKPNRSADRFRFCSKSSGERQPLRSAKSSE
jgi:hypothetical protein